MVLDTNVLVSALIRAEGLPARILDLILTGQVTLALDHRIYAEYQDVLARPEFGFAPEPVDTLLDFLLRSGERAYTTKTSVSLPDPADGKFLEVAIDGSADFLVSGNLSTSRPANAMAFESSARTNGGTAGAKASRNVRPVGCGVCPEECLISPRLQPDPDLTAI